MKIRMTDIITLLKDMIDRYFDIINKITDMIANGFLYTEQYIYKYC